MGTARINFFSIGCISLVLGVKLTGIGIFEKEEVMENYSGKLQTKWIKSLSEDARNKQRKSEGKNKGSQRKLKEKNPKEIEKEKIPK